MAKNLQGVEKLNEENTIEKIKKKIAVYRHKNEKQNLNLLKWINRLFGYAISESDKKEKYWAYSRGSIIKVDFGFNVGHEIGGTHYAIVINKKDSIYSGTLNVIPLTSKKEKKKIRKHEIDLGNEFYAIVEHRLEATDRTLHIFNLYDSDLNKQLHLFYEEFGYEFCIFNDIISNKYFAIYIELQIEKNSSVNYELLKEKFDLRKQFYSKEAISSQNLRKELSFMKSGTIAKIDQMTTISKKRIINPVKSHHALNNIKLFDSTMDRINNKIKELYVFDS